MSKIENINLGLVGVGLRLSLITTLVSLFIFLFVLLTGLLGFDAFLWDHYASFPLYLGTSSPKNLNFLSSLEVVLDSYLSIDGYIYRPTMNIWILATSKILGLDFTYWYSFKVVLFLTSLTILGASLKVDSKTYLAPMLFGVFALTAPASPLLMLFSPDVILLFGLIILMLWTKYTLAELEKAPPLYRIAFLLASLLAIGLLAGGAKEVAPILAGLCTLLVVLRFHTTLQRSLMVMIAVAIPNLFLAVQVLRTALIRVSPGADSYFDTLYSQLLYSLPVGPSSIVLYFSLVIVIFGIGLGLSKAETRGRALFWGGILAISLLSLLLSSYGQSQPALRYSSLSAICNTAVLAYSVSLIVQYLGSKIDFSPSIQTFVALVFAIALPICILILSPSILVQLKAYKAYDENLQGTLDYTAFLVSQNQKVYYGGSRGEVGYNFQSHFGEFSGLHNYPAYTFEFYDGALDCDSAYFVIVESDINLGIHSNCEVSYIQADPEVSNESSVSLYNKLFDPVFDKGAPFFSNNGLRTSYVVAHVGPRSDIASNPIIHSTSWMVAYGGEVLRGDVRATPQGAPRLDAKLADEQFGRNDPIVAADNLGDNSSLGDGVSPEINARSARGNTISFLGGVGALGVTSGSLQTSSLGHLYIIDGFLKIPECKVVLVGARYSGGSDVYNENICEELGDTGYFHVPVSIDQGESLDLEFFVFVVLEAENILTFEDFSVHDIGRF